MTACPRCDHDVSAPVLASWMMTFSLAIPSGNARHSNGKAGYAYRTLRDAWTMAVKAEARRLAMPGATEKRRVLITRYYDTAQAQRQYDPDNFVAGCKSPVDALVRAGALLNDSRRWAEISYQQVKGSPARVTVLVEEVGYGAG